MKQLKQAMMGLLATIATYLLLMEGIGSARPSGKFLTGEDYLLFGLVVVSVLFLRYALEQYMVPLDQLTNDQKRTLRTISQTHYKKTAFAGSLCMGYLLLVLYGLDYFAWPLTKSPPLNTKAIHHVAEPTNYVLLALFFLTLASIAKVRGIVMHLMPPKEPGE